MDVTPQTFDLQELASRAGVTARTIRYYIKQGLLPSAESRGPLTRYTDGHLDRLHLINRLKQEHLPLSEIRLRLEDLNDAAIHRILEDSSPKKPQRSAAAYVRDVLAKRTRSPDASSWFPALHEVSGDSTGFVTASSVAYGGRVDEQETTVRSSRVKSEPRSTWERIGLSPDIELHVRRPLSRQQNNQLDELLKVARELMSEDDS
ncbi:MAG: MerR family transcriptional regulator [Gemmatimonadaceae bacterium]